MIIVTSYSRQNNLMNQSEIKANTCKWRQERESVRSSIR